MKKQLLVYIRGQVSQKGKGMIKKTKVAGCEVAGSNEVISCELVSNNDVSFLEGKIKTALESFGMASSQEKAAKDMVNMVLWDWYYFIRDHYTDHLQEKKDQYVKKLGVESGAIKDKLNK